METLQLNILLKKRKTKKTYIYLPCCLNRNKLLKTRIYSPTDIFSGYYFLPKLLVCINKLGLVQPIPFKEWGGGGVGSKSHPVWYALKRKKEPLTFLKRYFERLCLFIIRNILKKGCFLLCIFKLLWQLDHFLLINQEALARESILPPRFGAFVYYSTFLKLHGFWKLFSSNVSLDLRGVALSALFITTHFLFSAICWLLWTTSYVLIAPFSVLLCFYFL